MDKNDKDIVHLYARNKDVSTRNINEVIKCDNLVVRIPSDNNCKEAKNAKIDLAGNLENELFLCEGAEVVLK